MFLTADEEALMLAVLRRVRTQGDTVDIETIVLLGRMIVQKRSQNAAVSVSQVPSLDRHWGRSFQRRHHLGPRLRWGHTDRMMVMLCYALPVFFVRKIPSVFSSFNVNFLLTFWSSTVS